MNKKKYIFLLKSLLKLDIFWVLELVFIKNCIWKNCWNSWRRCIYKKLPYKSSSLVIFPNPSNWVVKRTCWRQLGVSFRMCVNFLSSKQKKKPNSIRFSTPSLSPPDREREREREETVRARLIIINYDEIRWKKEKKKKTFARNILID